VTDKSHVARPSVSPKAQGVAPASADDRPCLGAGPRFCAQARSHRNFALTAGLTERGR